MLVTMSKVELYRDALKGLKNWDEYLLKESGLPGPRGNIELGKVVAMEGNEDLFKRYLEYTSDEAPVNSPYEFLAFCGVLGMGRLLAEGNDDAMIILKECASDPRWRIREGVAMALQMLGMADMERLLDEMRKWSKGNALEKRAVAAALCEPALLKDPDCVVQVLHILDGITMAMSFIVDRKSDDFQALRKGMGYCWSVAVAADPEEGKRAMEKWFYTDDKDIMWVMKENLKKNRIERIDPAWTKKWAEYLKV
jgi:hypothetical protein